MISAGLAASRIMRERSAGWFGSIATKGVPARSAASRATGIPTPRDSRNATTSPGRAPCAVMCSARVAADALSWAYVRVVVPSSTATASGVAAACDATARTTSCAVVATSGRSGTSVL